MSDVDKLADRLTELHSERAGLASTAAKEDAAERARVEAA